MKKLLSITFTAIFAIGFTGCQSSETAQSGINQNNLVTETKQNSAAESLVVMKDRKGSMKESSPDAANAPYDLQFLDTMTEHHQDAVKMAQPIVAKTDNAELKVFAEKIITTQNKEITQLKNWREKWFAGKPAAMNAEMPGRMESTKGINMRKLEAPGGKALDMRFLVMMIRHHQGAITMSNEALDKAKQVEIKALANQVIKAREAEIKQMEIWKTAWSQ